jgi:hypothetical protein
MAPMAVLLVESELYRWQKANLSRADQLQLRYAEFGIGLDPSPGHHRTELPDGGIADYSAEGLLIEYHRLSLTTVELYRVYDLKAIEPSI